MQLQKSLLTDKFKKIIIIFWTCWWIVALWTDIVGALSHLQWLNASWAPDTNYPFLVTSLQMYPLPTWMPAIFFVGIIIWSFISTIAFCWASMGLCLDKSVWLKRAEYAFIISLSYWFAFFIADQIVMKFDLEENHMVQGGFQFLTFLALYILPDKDIHNGNNHCDGKA